MNKTIMMVIIAISVLAATALAQDTNQTTTTIDNTTTTILQNTTTTTIDNTTTTIPDNTTTTTVDNTTTTIPDNTTTTTIDNTTTTTIDGNTTTTIDNTTTTIEESRFTEGFQKLPKEYASGQVSDSELLSIIESNKLNPGIINRLAKTGRLTQEHIDAITETQFLPVGIFRKLLGRIGFGKNRPVESLIDNYNLTDSQLSSLIRNSELPSGTIKKIAGGKFAGAKTVTSLITTQELRSGAIKKLIDNQDLTQENIDTLLENPRLKNKYRSRLAAVNPKATQIEENANPKISGNAVNILDIEQDTIKNGNKLAEKKANNEVKKNSRGNNNNGNSGKRVNIGRQKSK